VDAADWIKLSEPRQAYGNLNFRGASCPMRSPDIWPSPRPPSQYFLRNSGGRYVEATGALEPVRGCINGKAPSPTRWA